MTESAPDVVNEVDLLGRALELVRARLPAGWLLEQTEQSPNFGPDALVRLSDSENHHATLVVEAKRSLVARDIHRVLSQFHAYADLALESGPVLPLVVSRYL